jgi:hypothetical protein
LLGHIRKRRTRPGVPGRAPRASDAASVDAKRRARRATRRAPAGRRVTILRGLRP